MSLCSGAGFNSSLYFMTKNIFLTSDITDVIIWGNISGQFHIDLQRAKVYRYKGAIRGPEGFSQNVLEMVYDR